MTWNPRESGVTEGRGESEVPERWSAQRKVEVVLRLLRGEDLAEVSREVQVSPPKLEEWRRVFLETGERGLRRRGRDRAERELIRTRAKLGEMTMRMELARELSRGTQFSAVGGHPVLRTRPSDGFGFSSVRLG